MMHTEKNGSQGMLRAFQRLAEREAGGGLADHQLESEKERLLWESEGSEAAERYRFERLYQSIELAEGPRATLLRVLLVLAAVGCVLGVVAWWCARLVS